MKIKKHRVWLLAGVVGAAAVALVLALASCSPTPPSGITLEEAIEIARQAVIDDAVMSLEDRDTKYVEQPTYWHIYFPHSSSFVRGGEPHVKVAKSDGAILNIRYTQ